MSGAVRPFEHVRNVVLRQHMKVCAGVDEGDWDAWQAPQAPL